MRNLLLLSALILVALLLAAEDASRDPARVPAAEGCLACHGRVEDSGPAHPVAALGCSPCHGGDPDSRDKRRAHQGLEGNPGDLRVVERTCGRVQCHPGQAARVKTSVMATNAGILAALDRLWAGGGDGVRDVRVLAASGPPWSEAEDYYAKMCSTCHLWRVRDPDLGEPGLRGGGCSGCHVVRAAGERSPDLGRLEHPRLSMRIPTENCVRCHNRSARIGLTYQGLLEDDGSGAPHAHGGPGGHLLYGGRHALRIPADVHFRAQMACIDCHMGNEVMGDGQTHGTLKGQLGIACEDCHEPRFKDHPKPPADAQRLARLNTAVPDMEGGLLVRTRKGVPLYALRPVPPAGGGAPKKAVLYRKLDGKALDIDLTSATKPHHTLPGHERLGCQACHSPFMPQCYGCHAVRYGGRRQRDHILEAETSGRWFEGRSYTRFRRPALGLARSERVMPFSPCQVFVSVFDASGAYDGDASVGSALMTSFDPHSTQRASRTCLDCHLDPKSMGLGSSRPGPGTEMRATYDPLASGFGLPVAPDRMAAPDGRPVQDFPGPGDRPFNAGELRAVRGVAPCLPCHGTYVDSLWPGYRKNRQHWHGGLAPECGLPAPPAGSGPGTVQSDTSLLDTLSTKTPHGERPRAEKTSHTGNTPK